jgi:hypothetical protein
VLDDSLSMNDRSKGQATAFENARKQIEALAKEIGKSTTKDRVVILPTSQIFLMDRDVPVDPALVWKERDQIKYKIYENLGENTRFEALKTDLNALKVSNLHLNLLQALDKARQLAADNAANRVTVHVYGDFRQVDWAKPHGDALGKKLAEIRKLGIKPELKDVASPTRAGEAKGTLKANENLAITDFRAGARIVGQDMPVEFEATITNFDSEERAVNVVAFDENTGKQMFEVDFKDVMPVRVPGGGTARVSFNKRFPWNLKPGESYFVNISMRIVKENGQALEDGLPNDDVRYATVEVRQSVPILIVDGERTKGRQENNDSFFIRNALISVPGASYDVEFGDVITGEASAKVLERGDLSRYPAIFMLNVPDLTPKQVTNLEKYVSEGGGVAFFLGPKIDADFYSSRAKEDGKIVYKDDFGLYKRGKGIFPVPLSAPFFPPDRFLESEVTNMEQILLRDDLFQDIAAYPVFGKIFNDKDQRFFLRDVAIKRYFKVPRADWVRDPSKVEELATLPNDNDSKTYVKAVLAMAGDSLEADNRSKLTQILMNPDFEAYKKGFAVHQKQLNDLVSPTSDKKAYRLAGALKAMLEDPGKKGVNGYPSLKEFWEKADPQIIALRNEINQLHDQAKYGDPFMVLRRHGAGQVIAVMTTAGKEWNNMGGGSLGAFVYQPIIWETLNQLSSQVSESKRLVGSSLTLTIDKEQFAKQSQLKMVRTYYRPVKEAEAQKVTDEKFGTAFGKDMLNFTFDRNLEPGLYITKLQEVDKDKVLATWGHVFNIDAENESRLERVESLAKILPEEAQDIAIVPADKPGTSLANRQSDFSESPWLFLIFLFVLVAEQALAVHLSFHLKGGEAELHAPKSGHVAPARAA